MKCCRNNTSQKYWSSERSRDKLLKLHRIFPVRAAFTALLLLLFHPPETSRSSEEKSIRLARQAGRQAGRKCTETMRFLLLLFHVATVKAFIAECSTSIVPVAAAAAHTRAARGRKTVAASALLPYPNSETSLPACLGWLALQMLQAREQCHCKYCRPESKSSQLPRSHLVGSFVGEQDLRIFARISFRMDLSSSTSKWVTE